MEIGRNYIELDVFNDIIDVWVWYDGGIMLKYDRNSCEIKCLDIGLFCNVWKGKYMNW
jgi:hypothetical protein